VTIRCGMPPANSAFTRPSSLLSPQATRCGPSCQISPACDTATSAISGTSSSSVKPASTRESAIASSLAEKPSAERSAPMLERSASSRLSISASQPAFRAILLSARTNCLRSNSVKSRNTTTGASANPSLRAAASRPRPAMMSPASLIRIGFEKPDVRMLPAMPRCGSAHCAHKGSTGQGTSIRPEGATYRSKRPSCSAIRASP
jgi:hypothetical protein